MRDKKKITRQKKEKEKKKRDHDTAHRPRGFFVQVEPALVVSQKLRLDVLKLGHLHRLQYIYGM